MKEPENEDGLLQQGCNANESLETEWKWQVIAMATRHHKMSH